MRKNEGGKIKGGRPDKTQIYKAKSGQIQHGFSQTRILYFKVTINLFKITRNL